MKSNDTVFFFLLLMNSALCAFIGGAGTYYGITQQRYEAVSMGYATNDGCFVWKDKATIAMEHYGLTEAPAWNANDPDLNIEVAPEAEPPELIYLPDYLQEAPKPEPEPPVPDVIAEYIKEPEVEEQLPLPPPPPLPPSIMDTVPNYEQESK